VFFVIFNLVNLDFMKILLSTYRREEALVWFKLDTGRVEQTTKGRALNFFNNFPLRFLRGGRGERGGAWPIREGARST
jgi:hypothetical protein